MVKLPIDSVLPELSDALRAHSAVVLEAPPGAGKTTRVPAALLDETWCKGGKILVIEPRRIAARLSASFVARSRGGVIGEEVGYRIRHESRVGQNSRLIFQTEGLVLRQLAGDPQLREFDIVIFDEFHERNIASDLILAILSKLQQGARPDLKLVVMSATLNAEFIESYLLGCARIRSEGRAFPVEVEYLSHRSERRLEKEVRSAVAKSLKQDDGDILVFLPGISEINRCLDECASLLASVDAVGMPLYGALSPKEQERAVNPLERRKVIFSTNVAETSVTIDGVTTVIDSGLARIAKMGAGGLYTSLGLEPISQASAIQRAGRAGRTQAGRCLRLYTKSHFNQRIAYDVPEVMRSDLSDAILLLASMGLSDLEAFPFITRPKDDAIRAAQVLLYRLGAIESQGNITEDGRRFLSLPLHPRFAKLVIESAQSGIGDWGVLAAAILSERDFRYEETPLDAGPSDVLALCELYQDAKRSKFSPHRIRKLGLNEKTLRAIEKTRVQLQKLIKDHAVDKKSSNEDSEALFCRILMKSFPDRIAKRVSAGGDRRGRREILLVSGGRANLSEMSGVGDAEYVIAVKMDERRSHGRAKLWARVASTVESEWILDEWIDWLDEKTELNFHPKRERVEVCEALMLGSICLDETVDVAKPTMESAKILSKAAWSVRHKLGLGDECDSLLARLQLIQANLPDVGIDFGTLNSPEDVVRLACHGRVSFQELKGMSIESAILGGFEYSQQQLLQEAAPKHLQLASGKRLVIHYETGKPPWIESYLQDFFGMTQSPTVAKGRVPVTVHLWAPNKRPIQVTTDLEGFWERHYPDLCKALSRRYPRHHWAEQPKSAPPLLLKRHLKA